MYVWVCGCWTRLSQAHIVLSRSLTPISLVCRSHAPRAPPPVSLRLKRRVNGTLYVRLLSLGVICNATLLYADLIMR
ncbi:hypothetical protein F4774DRAFT_375175 [Daldinia eschscholtzii]|nr:hypothetical protein F4774DRAFT_375175 [Daldinia eschscholtzii]